MLRKNTIIGFVLYVLLLLCLKIKLSTNLSFVSFFFELNKAPFAITLFSLYTLGVSG